MIRKLLTFGVRVEVLQLTFSAGAIAGMLYMALLLTVPTLARAIWGRL